MVKKRKLNSKLDLSAAGGGDSKEPIQVSCEEEEEQEDAPHEPIHEEEEEDQQQQHQDHESNGAAREEDAAAEDDNDAAERDPAAIQNLLEPFPKDQLVELLRDAAISHPDVLAKVYRIADADPAHRKIFVHGLAWDATADTLIAAFREYGEIEDCKAVIDKVSGKSKGYGFILFKHRSGARRALKEPQKKIGNRMAACQLASAGPPSASAPPPAPPVSEYTQRKIYVSNVGADLDPQKLLQFFSQYGEIEEGPLGLDKVTGKPKGFCLFVYKTIESARKSLEEPHKNFEGAILHCQKAIDGPKPGKLGFSSGGGHHGGFQHGGVGAHGGQFSRNGNAPGHTSVGHLMAPPATGLNYNQPNPQTSLAGLNPSLGQALTAILANQGGGLGGLPNLLGGGHGVQGGYGNQAAGGSSMMGGYGAQAPVQGGYGNPPVGQGRNQPGAGYSGPPYMGR